MKDQKYKCIYLQCGSKQEAGGGGGGGHGIPCLGFRTWLASITERINQTMHYQFSGNPEPLGNQQTTNKVQDVSKKVFDRVQR